MSVVKYGSLLISIPLILSMVMATYPFIKDLRLTSFSMNGNTVTVSGTMDVHFTPQAWNDFGYKPNNFYYFNAWWQAEVGKVIYQSGRTEVILKSVTWTVLEHTATYDRLSFKFTVEIENPPREIWLASFL
jgi:hypothetical protein